MTTLHDIALLRLVAQRIAGPGAATAADAVRWQTALQAQDLNGALTSVALRTAAGTRQVVVAALDAGEIVRSWPMRGTLHLVAAEDLPWILRLAAPRVVAGAAARHAQLGLDTSTLETARELAVKALTGGHRLRRDDLLAAWNDGGLVTAGQRGYHLLAHLAQTGTVCFGPMRDGEQLLVLIDEWIAHPRRPEREEALGELAWRYFRSHGPATVKDFTRWTNLVAADVRAGLALARPRLTRLDVDGVEYFMDPRTADLLKTCRRRARGVFLLPGFDEFILGYADRRAVLPTEFAARIVPGGNGVFRPTVVSDGRVVGTWKHAGHGAKRTVAATPFVAFPDEVAEMVPEVYANLP
ncbi:winged helix DNA-binding domain-containing protein [Planosporangium sp. 12N6]|uniref:winged helix DNA-binding domain-containing protein n=1 Tax=Planosporangium spinosum TaxID=3402278 RepID=UPI003CF30174